MLAELFKHTACFASEFCWILDIGENELPYVLVPKSVDKVLQHHGNVRVKRSNDDLFCGGSDFLYSNYAGNISAATLEVEFPAKKIQFPDFPTILHEFQHIADQLFNPKYTARQQYMTFRDYYSDKYNYLYDNILYERVYPNGRKDKRKILYKIESKIRRFLKGLSAQDKLHYIQDTRYHLMSEDLAYKTERKYSKRLKKKHIMLDEGSFFDENKAHLLKEKIEILNRLGFEIIAKERRRHAAKLAKIKKCKNNSQISQ